MYLFKFLVLSRMLRISRKSPPIEPLFPPPIGGAQVPPIPGSELKTLVISQSSWEHEGLNYLIIQKAYFIA